MDRLRYRKKVTLGIAAFRLMTIAHILIWAVVFFVADLFGQTGTSWASSWMVVLAPLPIIAVDLAALARHSFRILFSNPWLGTWFDKIAIAFLMMFGLYFTGVTWVQAKAHVRQVEEDIREGTRMLDEVLKMRGVSGKDHRQLRRLLRRRSMGAARAFFGELRERKCRREELLLQAERMHIRQQVEQLLAAGRDGEADRMLVRVQELLKVANPFKGCGERDVIEMIRRGDLNDADRHLQWLWESAVRDRVLGALHDRIDQTRPEHRDELRRLLAAVARCEYNSRPWRKALYPLEKRMTELGL